MTAIAKKLCHVTPKAYMIDPTVAPTLAVAGTGTSVAGGVYYVGYTWVNADGETKMSPTASISVTAGQNIGVTIPSLPEGASSANVYMSTVAGSETLQGSTITTSYTQSVAVNGSTAAKPTTNNTIPVTHYTVPANNTTILRNVIMTNTSDNNVKITINTIPSGGTNQKGNRMVSEYELLPHDTAVLDLGAPLNAGDFIQAQQTEAGAVNLYISGVEVV